MADFIRIVEVVLPLLILMFLGYLGKRIGLLNESLVGGINTLVFKVFLPINIFYNIYRASSLLEADFTIFIYILIVLLVIIGLSYFIYFKMGFSRDEIAILLQTLVKTNIVLFGMSLAQNIFPPEKLGIIAIYSGITPIITNSLAILIHEFLSEKKKRINIFSIGKSVLLNPIIIASILGIIFNVLSISIYKPVLKVVDDLSSLASPLGLICIGASIKFDESGLDKKALITSLLSKTVFPILAILFFIFMGYRGVEIFSIIIIFQTPAAVSSYSIASMYTDRGELCAKIIAYTTVWNSLMIFISLYFLSSFNKL